MSKKNDTPPPKKRGLLGRVVDQIVLGPESGRMSGTNRMDEELHELIDQSDTDKEDPK